MVQIFGFTKKARGNQYLDVLRMLVLPWILVPLATPAKFRGNSYVQLMNLQDHRHESDFDIYLLVTISSFPQKLAQNRYICAQEY